MALTNEDLQAIAALLDTKLDIKLKPIEQRLDNIESKVLALQNDVADVKETVNKNYTLTEEFYVSQKEHHTEIADSLAIVTGELDMHNHQIARNTAELKRVK